MEFVGAFCYGKASALAVGGKKALSLSLMVADESTDFLPCQRLGKATNYSVVAIVVIRAMDR